VVFAQTAEVTVYGCVATMFSALSAALYMPPYTRLKQTLRKKYHLHFNAVNTEVCSMISGCCEATECYTSAHGWCATDSRGHDKKLTAW
jgi:hypothetical protein